jgi:hypothetical protein
MFLLLPLMAFLLLYLMCQRIENAPRVSVLSAALLLGSVLTSITEILSLFGRLTFHWIAGSWAFVVVILAIIYFFLARMKQPSEITQPTGTPHGFYLFPLYALGLVLATTGLTALFSPPNNWDSMSYHMARVANWVQNQSVSHYPTNIVRQLYMPPWAEFAITHLQVLSGGDHYANMVQWLSMVGSLVAVSLVAASLGGGSRAQVMAVVFAGTLPMGILQSSSTQNDYVAAFWLVCFVYFGLLLMTRAPEFPHYYDSVRTGMAFGLALLTKGTTYFYLLPFLVWICYSVIRQRGKAGLKPLILVFAIAVIINIGHYSRQYDLFGSPLGVSDKLTNDVFTMGGAVSNVVRGVALHLGTGVDALDKTAETVIRYFHHVLGIDVNDSRTTWIGTKFYIPELSTHEDTTGNPVHIVLILITLVMSVRISNRPTPLVSTYMCVFFGSILLFDFLLKWTPWHSRLHLPLFILVAPFVGVQLARCVGAKLLSILSVGLVAMSAYWALNNQSRPVFGVRSVFKADRISQYFTNRPELQDPYERAVEEVRCRGCQRVALSLGWHGWEYPFWVLLNRTGQGSVKIGHFDVKNLSGVKSAGSAFHAANPDCLITSFHKDQDIISTGEATYGLISRFGRLSVFGAK